MAAHKPQLRTLLFIGFLCTAIVPVTLLGWWTDRTLSERTYQLVEEKHLLVARNLTSALSVYARDLTLTLEYTAKKSQLDFATRQLLSNQHIFALHLLDAQGHESTSLLTTEDASANPLSDKQLALYRSLPAYGFSTLHTGSNGQPTLLIRVPRPHAMGDLVAELATNYFRTLQAAISFGERGHAAIVDQAGNVIAHPKPTWVASMKNIAKVSAVARMMAGQSGVEIFYSPALKADMIAGFSTVQQTGWGAMIPQPIAELQQQITELRQGAIAIGFSGILLAALISWFLADKLAGPSRRLAEQARLLARQPASPITLDKALTREQQELSEAFEQMASAVAEKNATLLFNAQHDSLTGLANRLLFASQIDALIETGQDFTIALLDLNDFKEINDHWGHAQGDRVLQAVARKIDKAGGVDSLAARLGGDEFGILFDPAMRQSDIEQSARQLAEQLSGEFQVLDDNLLGGCSVGLTRHPDDAQSAHDLLQCADLAMYQHKANRDADFRWFEPWMRQQLDEHVQLKADLQQALAKEQLQLHYQPKVDAKTYRLRGLEALLRWNHPQHGAISPGVFIPLIEQSTLINDISDWVLKTLCEQVIKWREQGLTPPPVAINLSHAQFDDPNLAQRLISAINTHQLAGQCIELEITESIVARHPERVHKTIEVLKQHGCRVTIDDLGTGHSSLARINELDIDSIKIDQSFLTEITTNVRSANLLHQVVGIGLALNLRVIVEGVENHEQLLIVQSTDCHEIQGHFFSQAVDGDSISKLLNAEAQSGQPALGNR